MRRDKNGSLDKVVAVLRRAVRRRRDNEGDGKGLLSPSPCGEGEVGTGQPDLSYAVSSRSATELTLGDENGYAKYRIKIGANQTLYR